MSLTNQLIAAKIAGTMKKLPRLPLIIILAALLTACAGGNSNLTPEPTVFIPVIGTGQPTATGGPTAVPATELAPAEWASLGLAGRLQYTLGQEGVQQLDLASGETHPVFVPP